MLHSSSYASFLITFTSPPGLPSSNSTNASSLPSSGSLVRFWSHFHILIAAFLVSPFSGLILTFWYKPNLCLSYIPFLLLCEYLTLASWSSFPVNLHFRQNSSLSPINLDLFWQHSFSSFWSPKFRLQSVTSRDGLNQQIVGKIHHSVTNITSKKIHHPYHFHIILKHRPCSHCKFSGEKDRCFFAGLFPVLVFHLQLLVLELLSDAGTGEVSRVEQRYLQIDRSHCDRGGHVSHVDRCRCDRQWGRTRYIWPQLRDEDCLENCLSNFPTFICMYAIMHPGAHNYTDKSMCTRELVIADAKWCSVHCPPATLLVQNFSPAPWWQTKKW